MGKKYSCILSNDLERSEELVDAAIKMADLSPIEGLFLLYFSYLVRGFLLTVFQKQILTSSNISRSEHVASRGSIYLCK
ncbi:hypothetical protein [Anaplasma phagocytophilum]|uniref:Uncharacterized protein n=1 Tax=Anaplasma phagocytophilum TaxID=948 RepID=A0A098GJG3_ANAPH|nr:hypothetical protein [Anaplasma phagocytophilum]CEH11150.1 Uncharacterized protein ANAPHAGO_00575 [Anaplasma phagocytophilum]